MLIEKLQTEYTNESKLEYHLMVVLSILTALFQISEGSNIPILSYFTAGIFILYCSWLDNTNILYVLMFFMPINRLITFYGISLNLIILIIYCFKDIIKNKLQLYKNLTIYSVLLFFYMFIYYIRYNSISEIFQAIKIFLVLYFCLIFFINDKYNTISIYRSAILYLAIGIIINSLLSFVFNVQTLDESRFALSEDSNQNSLGIVCAYAIAQLAVFGNDKNISRVYSFYILFLGICVIGILTQSRSFLLSLSIVFLWILFLSGKVKLSEIMKNIFFVGGVIIAGYMIIIYSKSGFSNIFQSAIYRIILPKNEDVTNGRLLIWNYYIYYLKNHLYVLLFGVGNDYTRIGIEFVAHNAWLEMVTAYGLAGTLLLIGYYISVSKFIAKNMLKNYSFAGIFNILPLIIVFACGMFSHSFLSLNNTLQMFLGVVVLFNKPRENNLDHTSYLP